MAKILGTNDDEHKCCLCGKVELKRVVWIEHNDGQVAWYGTTCACKVLKMEAAELCKQLKAGKEKSTKERDAFLLPFKHASNAACIEAHSDRSVPLKQRLQKIYSSPAHIAEKAAISEARQRWPWLY